MTSHTDVAVITASNGENLKLASRFIDVSHELSIKSRLIDLTTIDLPLFNPRVNNSESEKVSLLSKDLNDQLSEAERWVICAPEYNGSIPPTLSNAIAWLSIQEQDFRHLFNGRPIGLASVSGGGCMELLVSMRIQLSHLGAQVLGRQLSSNTRNPAKDESIKSLLLLLMQMKRLKS